MIAVAGRRPVVVVVVAAVVAVAFKDITNLVVCNSELRCCWPLASYLSSHLT